jgi:hypothetical protein
MWKTINWRKASVKKKQKEFFDFQYYLDKESLDLRAFYDC